MLSPKYYPYLTGLVATALVVAPYWAFLSMTSHEDDVFDSVDLSMLEPTDARSARNAAHRDITAAIPGSVPMPLDLRTLRPSPVAPVTQPHVDTKPTESSRPSEQVAGLAASLAGVAPTPVESPVDTRVAMVPRLPGSAPVAFKPHSEGSPATTSTPHTSAATASSSAITEHSMGVPDVVNTDSDVAPPDDLAAATDADRRQAPMVPTQNPPSHFDATGHLAMAGGVPPGIGGVPVLAEPNPDADSRKSSRDHRSRSGTTSRKPVRPAPANRGANMPWTSTPGDGFSGDAPAPIVDVILQQPLESRRVTKVENVVAVTGEKGWPVALVRSDLPDDLWWVQQMVGVRGRAFAARVNFGNEHSIPGSVYHMVFVFLDSPDEVRRFRIAKQFEQLPEGLRRSREFTFIRR